jgi:hypothetical protein
MNPRLGFESQRRLLHSNIPIREMGCPEYRPLCGTPLHQFGQDRLFRAGAAVTTRFTSRLHSCFPQPNGSQIASPHDWGASDPGWNPRGAIRMRFREPNSLPESSCTYAPMRALPTLESGWQAYLQRRCRVTAAVSRHRPQAIFTLDTRARSGPHFSARDLPAAHL